MDMGFQIENVQFNVHKYQLVKSQTFADMFAIAEQARKKGDDHSLIHRWNRVIVCTRRNGHVPSFATGIWRSK